jgi:hypothetical protein
LASGSWEETIHIWNPKWNNYFLNWKITKHFFK